VQETVFNHGIYWHSITTTLFQGGAIAMGAGLLVRLLTVRPWEVRGVDVRRANETLVTLLAVWNLFFALLAGFTGLYSTWGFDAVSSVTLTVNKTMIGTFGLLSLISMIGIRYRYGAGLWADTSLKASYAVLGIIVSGVAVVTGSLGGEAALLGTVLDWLWSVLNIEPRFPMVLPTWGSGILIAVVVVGVGTALALRLTGRIRPKV
jgi:hypothetical protein